MPDRARARALVAALLLVLTVAGIRAIGPPGDWGKHASHAVAVGVLLEVVLACLFAGLRWRHTPQGALAASMHRLLSGALTAAMIGIAIAILFSQFNGRPGKLARNPIPRLGSRPLRFHVQPHRGDLDLDLLRDVVVVLAVIAILVVLARIWWHRSRRRLALGLVPGVVVEVSEADLARAVESGRAALRELDDARAAIIRCYVAMEQSLTEAGAERGVAETPDELLARAVDVSLVPQAPAERLTALFYEARYSTHPMPASQRDEAERSLAGIAAVLPVSEPT